MTGVLALVTGSREWEDTETLHGALEAVEPSLVIQGGAKGADDHACEWCKTNGVWCIEVPALWDYHGKSAGPKRNEFMLKLARTLEKATGYELVVLAFPTVSSKGTTHMIRICKEAGYDVHLYEEKE